MGGERIRKPSLSGLRKPSRTILLLLVVASASFIAGSFGNLVTVQQVQSLAGNHVLVPAPELRILNTLWTIDGTASLVTGVVLEITTVSPSGVPAGTKLYQVFIQVSCLDATMKEFVCSTGTNSIVLPTNMNGASTTLAIATSPSVDPEVIEVHDLSFIVTGRPITGTPAPCSSDFAIGASPTTINLNVLTSPTGDSKITLTSLCSFQGQVSLGASVDPTSGLSIVLNPLSVSVPANGSASTTLGVVASTSKTGSFPVTVTAIDTSGTIVHSVTVTVNLSA